MNILLDPFSKLMFSIREFRLLIFKIIFKVVCSLQSWYCGVLFCSGFGCCVHTGIPSFSSYSFVCFFLTTVSWLCLFLSSAWCITSCNLFSFHLLDIIFLDCLYLGKFYFLLQRWQIALPNIVVYVGSHGILKCVAPGSCHSEIFYLGISCSSGWFFLICDFCFFSW